jgi:hypothetical protein
MEKEETNHVNSIIKPTTGFILNTIMNKYSNEGYKFIQKVDNSKMYDDSTEWEEEELSSFILAEDKENINTESTIITF